MNFEIKVSIERDRVVLRTGGAPPKIVGRIVRCPCCGAPTSYVGA